ncbi:glycosyltransferase family 1 protein [Cytophagaceae bacterium 50C-KIRBA]|uniref:Glycosyltransferase family 1 protein n=1 Tax=Aquirufa beregesia TaxID=2516556 RepID=A0ABX0EWZ1_9BACT|nr:glycosyltransferase [Aquirufa beregesia]NGZ44435.1 glycosyltransferase family 1 protein [Aquirufa beregesia]
MSAPLTYRLSIFDSIDDGHHADYLAYLIHQFSHKPEVELLLIVPETFIQSFKNNRQTWGFDLGNNIHFHSLDAPTIQDLHRQSIYKRSIAEWNMYVDISEAWETTHGLLMYFDYFQLGILLGKKAHFQLGGIYFRPNFYYRKASWKSAFIKKWMLRLSTFRSSMKVLFSLDHKAVKHIRPLLGKTQVMRISDPVRAYELSPDELRAFQKQWHIPADKKVCLIFGYLDPRKGIEAFLQSTQHLTPEELNQLCLLVAGAISPAYQAHLEELFHQYPDVEVISIFQEIKGKDIQLCFEASDLVLMLYQNHVGMSSVLVRASISKKVVLGTHYGLLGKLIQSMHLGLVVNAQSPVQIAEQLEQYLNLGIGYSKEQMEKMVHENSEQAFADTLYQGLFL